VDDSVLVHDAVVFGEGRVFAKSRYPEHALLGLQPGPFLKPSVAGELLAQGKILKSE
jgi:hypothetical protein